MWLVNTDLTVRKSSPIIVGSSSGEVPEWLKGADCKSVDLASTLVRIQPSPPRDLNWVCRVMHKIGCTEGLRKLDKSGCSSMVEQKPSKLTTRVRFPSPAPVSVSAVSNRC